MHKFNNVSIAGGAWFYPVIACSKFIYCVSCAFINLCTDKVTLSMAAFSQNKPAYAGTARGICGALGCTAQLLSCGVCRIF